MRLRSAILASAIILGILVRQDGAVGQTTILSGVINKFDGVNVVALTDTCTTSRDFADMPEMMVSFRQDGHGPAIVLFQGRWFNNTGDPARVRVRLAIDTVTNVEEDAGMWTLQGGRIPIAPNQINGSSGMNWVTDSLTPGEHVATIQWRSQFGQEICVSRRTLIVIHK